MADLSNQSVLGIAVESVAGTYVAPTTNDLIRVSDLRISINGITVNINEYTGSIHRPGPVVLGKTFEVSGRVFLRGPGGSTVPAANAFVPGRIIRAAGFDETVQAAAIPAAPEALGAGSTTTVANLGTTAAGTLGIYKAMGVLLAALGTMPKGMAMIRSYSAAKAALLARTAGSTITGNYQIPKQLSYRLNASATPPSLSASCWYGGRRYNGNGLAISSFRINIPTASRDSQELPSIEFTLSGDLESDASETAPIPPAVLAIPPFRDGNLWINNTQLAGTSLTIDLGAEVGYPPNPNRPSGNDPAQLVGTTRTVNFTIAQTLKATFDQIALADAQGYLAMEAGWGLGTGNSFGVIVTDARLNYANPDNSGPFVNLTGEAYVDDADRTIGITLPFYP
jgi:hypothetical protein